MLYFWDSGRGSLQKVQSYIYVIACQLCPADDQAVYLGETARNLYTRGREHQCNYEKRREVSFKHKHQEDCTMAWRGNSEL